MVCRFGAGSSKCHGGAHSTVEIELGDMDGARNGALHGVAPLG
jgi:hypothetical protein